MDYVREQQMSPRTPTVATGLYPRSMHDVILRMPVTLTSFRRGTPSIAIVNCLALYCECYYFCWKGVYRLWDVDRIRVYLRVLF